MDIIFFGLLAWFGGGAICSVFGTASSIAQAKAQADYTRKKSEMEQRKCVKQSTDC